MMRKKQTLYNDNWEDSDNLEDYIQLQQLVDN